MPPDTAARDDAILSSIARLSADLQQAQREIQVLQILLGATPAMPPPPRPKFWAVEQPGGKVHIIPTTES